MVQIYYFLTVDAKNQNFASFSGNKNKRIHTGTTTILFYRTEDQRKGLLAHPFLEALHNLHFVLDHKARTRGKEESRSPLHLSPFAAYLACEAGLPKEVDPSLPVWHPV